MYLYRYLPFSAVNVALNDKICYLVTKTEQFAQGLKRMQKAKAVIQTVLGFPNRQLC